MISSLKDVLSDDVILQDLKRDPTSFKFPVAPLVTVAVEGWLPHVDLTEDFRTGEIKIHGPLANTLEALATSLNFTYELVRPPDGAWGVLQPDRTWSGMVGMIHRKEADLALGPFAMKKDRASVVDYSPPLLIDYTRFLVIQNPPISNPWGFFNPFGYDMWIGILLTYLAISLCTIVIVAAYKEHSWRAYFIGTSNVLFQQARIFLQEDLTVKSNIPGMRILIGSWLLFCLVIGKSYAGVLVSLLAVRYLPKPIDSLQQLVEHPSMSVIIERSSAISSFIEQSKSGLIGELNALSRSDRLVPKGSSQHQDALSFDVAAGTHAILLEELSLKALLSNNFTMTGKCSFYMPKDLFLPWIFGMIGQKKAPLMAAVSHRIDGITTAGLYTKWLNEMLPNGTACANVPASITVSEPYSITGLWGVFTLLIGGLVVSIFVFLVEMFYPIFNISVDASTFDVTREEQKRNDVLELETHHQQWQMQPPPKHRKQKRQHPQQNRRLPQQIRQQPKQQPQQYWLQPQQQPQQNRQQPQQQPQQKRQQPQQQPQQNRQQPQQQPQQNQQHPQKQQQPNDDQQEQVDNEQQQQQEHHEEEQQEQVEEQSE